MVEVNKSLKRPVKVYNVETKTLIITYESFYEAAKALGMSHGHLRSCIINKSRCRKNKLNKTIAIR